jgi:hypothetical protein
MEQGSFRLVDFWYFIKSLSDLWIIAIAFTVYVTWNEAKHQQRLTLVEQPLINDLYLVDFLQIDRATDAQFRFLLLKVTDIDSNGIRFVTSNHKHSSPVEVADAVKFDVQLLVKNYFNEQTYTVSHDTFLSWADKGIIYDIDRPDGLYIRGSLVLRPDEAVEANKKNAKLILARQYKNE